MAKLAVLNMLGEKVKDITLKPEVWNIEPNDSVLYDAIIAIKAALRQGTSANKSRGMVSGSTKKIYRQKGTGRARAGSKRAPHRYGGGVAFAKVTRDFSIKMNRKEKKLALKSAVSYAINEKRIIVLDKLEMNEPKTKEMVKLLENIKADGKVLLVTNGFDENIVRSAKNVKGLKSINATSLNVLDVVNSNNIVMTMDAVKSVEEVLS